jgi:Ca2+-transporting ATPase
VKACGQGDLAFPSTCWARHSSFSWRTLEYPSTLVAGAAVIVLLVLIVEMDALHGFSTTINLTSSRWLVCAAVGSTVLWAGELVKTAWPTAARM